VCWFPQGLCTGCAFLYHSVFTHPIPLCEASGHQAATSCPETSQGHPPGPNLPHGNSVLAAMSVLYTGLSSTRASSVWVPVMFLGLTETHSGWPSAVC
jgi:hypothetical protein